MLLTKCSRNTEQDRCESCSREIHSLLGNKHFTNNHKCIECVTEMLWVLGEDIMKISNLVQGLKESQLCDLTCMS